MKRSIFGFVLLALLLLSCLGVTALMARLHEPIAGTLEQAAGLAAGDFAGAVALAREANAAWNQAEPLSACFADHGPMEEIGQGFAQVEIFGDRGEPIAFAAACADLAEKLKAMSDAHGLKWRNLF